MKLSVAVTTYNRALLTVKSYDKILNDDRVDEIVVIDDCSKPQVYALLKSILQKSDKIRLIRNDVNVGMSQNKARAVSVCKNEWVILLDSDNEIDSGYLDALDWANFQDPHKIYCPDFARPNFDYTKYAGYDLDRFTIKGRLLESEMQCLINTCNYVVNREWYAKVYQSDKRIKETDTHWFNFLHLKAGGVLTVVPGLQYNHLVHKDSGWMKNANYNMESSKRINALILGL